MLIALGDSILARKVYKKDLLLRQDRGKIQSTCALAEHRSEQLVFNERFDPVQCRFRALFPFVSFDRRKPFPLSFDPWVANACSNRISIHIGRRVYHMLGL